MDSAARRRKLAQLLDLPQVYRDCTRKELAKTLGRDPTKLVPGRGIPKLDLVVELANVIEWPVGDVVDFLWDHQAPAPGDGDEDFESLDAAARRAHRAGHDRLTIQLARKAYAAAVTPRERVRACHREAIGWERLGRYLEVVQATTRALHEEGVSTVLRRLLQSNLANAYYSLWSLVESRSLARDLIGGYRQHPPRTGPDRKTQALAHAVAGHTLRRMMAVEPKQARTFAASAGKDLEIARTHCERLAGELGDARLGGIANTCRGGIIEVDVELGRRRVTDALAELVRGLDGVRDTSGDVARHHLESYGWWCIFGCNIALRHLSHERDLQQHMAVFTNKADEIANLLDNWSMRERVFSMHYTCWERAAGATCFEMPCVIDRDDIRTITGTMGRFPTFRERGWRILQTARVVD